DGRYPSGSPVAFLCLRAAAALTRTVRIGGGDRGTPTSPVRTMMGMAPLRRALFRRTAPASPPGTDTPCSPTAARAPRRRTLSFGIRSAHSLTRSGRAGAGRPSFFRCRLMTSPPLGRAVLGPRFHCSRQDSPRLDPGLEVGYLLHIPIDNSIERNTHESRAFGSHWHTRRAPGLVHSAHLG